MNKQTSRYLLGLLLALAPAAASSQVTTSPQLRPGQVVVARQDTLVNTRLDTVVVVKKDTSFVMKYDTMNVAQMANGLPIIINNNSVPDSVIARAVRIGVLEALQIAALLPQNQQQRQVPAQQAPPLQQQVPLQQQPATTVQHQVTAVLPVAQQPLTTQGIQPSQRRLAAPATTLTASAAQLSETDTPADTVNRPKYLQTWDNMQKRRRIQRIDRDAARRVFIPKGQWMMGASFNYQSWDTENINLLVLKNMELEGHTFSASPYFGYFLWNNICIGGRYNYHRDYFFLGQFDMNLGKLDLGDLGEDLDLSLSLEDLYYLEHTHEVAVFGRMYQPLGKKNIFAFFSDVRAIYAYSVGKNTTGSGKEFDGSFERAHTLQLAFCPGITYFVTDFMAAEASIGIMGLKYRWKNQQTNRIESGTSRSGGMNFKFNLLSINLGVTFYL